MPIFNAEKYLETSLNSIVNQSIGIENLQVILVNDGSTDKTKNIINEYAMKYDNFLAIHLENNIGGAYGPRNIGLKYAVADYLMFLDSDDRYELNACEILYNKISSKTYGNLDIVFGRYKRVYSNFDDFNNNFNNYNSSNNYNASNNSNNFNNFNNSNNSNLFNSSNSSNKYHDHEYIQKSYSPYEDNIDEFSDDILYNHYLSSISFFFWKNIFSPLFYGKKIKKYDTDNLNADNDYIKEIYIKNINEDINILKILPSIWTKIYKRDLIIENNIKFPPYISGEDLNFVVESYLNANGILFLNEVFVTDYYMRDSQDDKSVTKNVSFKLVFDSLKSYKNCLDLCNKYEFKHSALILNPFLLNWIKLFLKFKGNNNEKEKILTLAKQMKKSYNDGFIAKLLMSFTIFIIKFF